LTLEGWKRARIPSRHERVSNSRREYFHEGDPNALKLFYIARKVSFCVTY
jgi:hypothetical protein